ncbi:hypothetical protein AAGS40_28620 (plasmid) [Paraburkholderia sp. PREW-6R]|uniref:hypothetical protein n=1 Tax=Paraburkholderia sp. PREW-6R TaxID=3141544 RepID=UPI0031F51413
MNKLFLFSKLTLTLAAAGILVATPALAQTDSNGSAAQETAALSAQEGSWTVTDTFWARPGAAPVVSKGLVADRRMVGSLMEETLHAADSSRPLRIDYLGYDAIAGQWRYVSIEARIPVAPMSASSFERDGPDRITLRFEPFAAPPIAAGWAGRMLRMEEVVARDGRDHETKDQYFILADGTGTRWLAHRYDYQRQH